MKYIRKRKKILFYPYKTEIHNEFTRGSENLHLKVFSFFFLKAMQSWWTLASVRMGKKNVNTHNKILVLQIVPLKECDWSIYIAEVTEYQLWKGGIDLDNFVLYKHS